MVQIDEMMAKDAEDYNKLKIRLENDIQVRRWQNKEKIERPGCLTLWNRSWSVSWNTCVPSTC